ncbi:MAG: hypothetical protein AB7O50_13995, partial [Pseudolabrys sp.]
DATDLAAQIEKLTQAELNVLRFGVMLIGDDGTVRFYSETEAQLSGYKESAVGLNLYEFCERFGGPNFRGRIEEAAAQGTVNLEFGWKGDYGDPKRDLRIRVESARGGGLWIFVDRD